MSRSLERIKNRLKRLEAEPKYQPTVPDLDIRLAKALALARERGNPLDSIDLREYEGSGVPLDQRFANAVRLSREPIVAAEASNAESINPN